MTTALKASREQMVMQIMTLVGRSQPNPGAYYRHLMALDYEELTALYNDVMERTLGERVGR